MNTLDHTTRKTNKAGCTGVTAGRNRRVGEPTAAKTRKRQVIASFGPEIEERITVVEAQVELRPSDSVYIRGQGSGLSWDAGQPMTCVERAKWVWCTRRAEPGTEFKVLVNDELWAVGENAKLCPGEVVTVQPQFEWGA